MTDFTKARDEHAAELKNLCGAYALPYPLPLTSDGLIGGSDFQEIRRKLASFPDTTYALRDRERFTYLLRQCGHI